MSARTLAIEILARVEATDAYLNVVLDQKLAEEVSLERRDAALVTELCYGTLRRLRLLDDALAQASTRPLAKLEDKVLAALRVGAYQLFFTRIPRHAAVAETVEALKSVKMGRATGLANAVLRKLSAQTSLAVPAGLGPVSALALRESHPEWLVRRWVHRHGQELATRMCEADNRAPSLVLRANSARISRDELLEHFREAGTEAAAAQHSSVGLLLPGPGRVEDLYGYSEGLWQVQDEAAQLVGLYAAVPEGASVLDACAAPGGKACHLAETRRVLALDLHANKLRKIAAEAERLGLSERLKVQAQDARKLPEALGTFEAVIVDAPCTGLGTLRRHPEIRYRREEKDVQRLAKLQAEILSSTQAHVASGGLLVYAVCSTEPEEGARQVTAFLERHPEFRLEPPPHWRGPALVDGQLVTLPGPEEMDGFFAARLRRAF